MTKDKFWEVIDNARAIAPALEGEPLRESLYKQLLTLSPDELVGFDCAWQEYTVLKDGRKPNKAGIKSTKI